MGHYEPKTYTRKNDRHINRKPIPRGLKQKFVAVDGEGIGNDYVLLDSSVGSYPRLYTGKRLTTTEILDWLWNLAKHKDTKSCDFVLFGAGYDYNNWLRDVRDDDRTGKQLALAQAIENAKTECPDAVKDFAKGGIVWHRPYLIQWMQGYKFEIRKWNLSYANNYEPVQRGTDTSTSLIFWDAYPFWQTSFVDAIESTLGDVPPLITKGKEARGSFTHENIGWVSEYNRLECSLLIDMMTELKEWLHRANIRLISWNGPGATAKAMLRTHKPYLHSGRELRGGEHSRSSDVGAYLCPPELLEAALSAYAGGRNQILQVGYVDKAYQYDIISAYPSAMVHLPCLTHGHWQRTSSFTPNRFGVWRVRYRTALDGLYPIYPLFHRDTTDGTIHYPSVVDWRWAHTVEVANALKWDRAGVTVDYGWVWIPEVCSKPKPFDWVSRSFFQRKTYKLKGEKGASTAIKLALNSLYGSLAQARGGTVEDPPWSQQLLWAGAITATIRTKLHNASMLDPAAALHMATDGLITSRELPGIGIGTALGAWEVSELTDLTLVQYGVYFSNEKSRSRGFSKDLLPDFVGRVHEIWNRRGRGYEQIHYDVPYFVTCGLVANGMEPYDEWCHWKQRPEKLSVYVNDLYSRVEPESVRPDALVPVREDTRYMETTGASAPYEPKWGKGENFPYSAPDDMYVKKEDPAYLSDMPAA